MRLPDPTPIEPERWLSRLAPVLAVGLAIFFTAWGGRALFEYVTEPEPKRYPNIGWSNLALVPEGQIVDRCQGQEVLAWDSDHSALYCSGEFE